MAKRSKSECPVSIPRPHAREQPLPSQRLEVPAKDSGAPARLRAILASPSHLEADRDTTFLNLGKARAPRLELDYLKAELLLEQHGIAGTIVVFGSTRIPEPTTARRRVQRLRRAIAQFGDSAARRRQLAIARRIESHSRYYDTARELGRLVGAAGAGVTVMTGGGPGIMEAANRGAFEVGAPTVGLNISLPNEQYPNPYVTPDLCFTFHYFAIRKLHFLLRAKALVAFPGGYGTLDEIFETLALVQTRKIRPIPVVLVGEAYWRRAIDLDFLADQGAIDPEDKKLLRYAETAAEIWDGILRWHATNGAPLLAPRPRTRRTTA